MPITYIAGRKEYWQKLKEKLSEEVREFGKKEIAEEIADILEVIDAICEYLEFDQRSIRLFRKKKEHLRKELFWRNHKKARDKI